MRSFPDPSPDYVLYLAIPAQNEVATIGVLLWRLRTVLAEFPREYEVVVYDDASSDETADVAEQYAHAMPVTVLRGTKPVGYAGAVDALVRYVSGHTRYPRRDAMLLLQADFTDPPGIVPEFARRFEGGADLVIGERTAVVDAPVPVKRLFTAASWALRPFVRVDGIKDLTGSMRLARISVLRDALRTSGDAPVCDGDSWTANADLLLRLVPHARRVETVPLEPTYGVRMRDSRRITLRDALATLRWGWRARGRKATPTTVPEAAEAAARPPRGQQLPAPKRRDEPEMTAERLRERKRDRERPRSDSGLEDAAEDARRERGRRDRREARADKDTRPTNEATETAAPRDPGARPAASRPRPEAEETRPPRDARPPRAERAKEERTKEERPRRERDRARTNEPRRGRDAATQNSADLDQALDDPFAAPTARRDAAASPYAPEPEESVNASDASTENAAARPASPQRPRPTGDQLTPNSTKESGADSDADEETDGEDAESIEVGEGTDSAARERKRRRNRRSRRRKSKQREANADGSAESSVENSGENSGEESSEHSEGRVSSDAAGSSDDEQSRSASNRPRANRPRPERSEADASQIGRGAEGDEAGSDDMGADQSDDGGSDDSEAGDGESAGQARTKRRGRRGRRGGARRSRNRGRTAEGGEAGDEGGGGDAGSGGGSTASEGSGGDWQE